MSENLKEIVNNGTLENTIDSITVTSVITQIADLPSGSQRSESEVHIFKHICCHRFNRFGKNREKRDQHFLS